MENNCACALASVLGLGIGTIGDSLISIMSPEPEVNCRNHNMSFSLLTMVPDIYSFAMEEKEHGGIGTSGNADIGKSLYNGQRLDVRPTHNSDPMNLGTLNLNRRPSRRAIQGEGGPLKSSLKSRSSLGTSQTSIEFESDLSEGFAQRQRPMQSKWNVSFSNLEIRTYAYGVTLALGDSVDGDVDSPTLSVSGPPNSISLDWKYHPQATQVHDIDSYEHLRSVTPDNPTPLNPRRRGGELLIQPSRRSILIEDTRRAAKERQMGALRSKARKDELFEKAKSRLRVWQKKNAR